MDSKLRTGTEASGIVAISIAVTLAMSGSYIPAAVAGVLGIALLVVYEKFGIEGIKLTEEEVKRISEGVKTIKTSDSIDEAVDEATDVTDDVDPTEN